MLCIVGTSGKPLSNPVSLFRTDILIFFSASYVNYGIIPLMLSTKNQKSTHTKTYRDLSITWKIWIAFLLIIFSSIIMLTVISNRITSRTIIDQALTASNRSVLQVAERLDTALDTMENLTKMAIADNRLQLLLDGKENTDTYELYTTQQELKTILNIFVEPRTNLEALVVYDVNGDSYVSGNLQVFDSPEKAYVKEMLDQLTPERLQIWQDTKVSRYTKNLLRSNVISLYRKIYNGRSAEVIGLIEATLNERELAALYKNIRLGETGEIFISDAAGNILSHANKARLYQDISQEPYFPTLIKSKSEGSIYTLHGEQNLVVHYQYPRTGWIIIGTAPLPEILGTAQRISFQLILLGVLAILITTIFSFLISSGITKPIRELKEIMHQAGEGALEVRSIPKNHDEIGILSLEFNHMLDRIHKLMDANLQEQKTIRQYELSLLQAQINPHFLNNALENICGLIEMGNTEDSIALISDIARFYRSILARGETIISIREELTNVELYIRILNVRYQGRIEFMQTIDPEIMDEQIIKLTLQPLIENSIYHGLKEKRGPWYLKLTGCKTSEGVLLTLEDNGKGLSKQQLDEILSLKTVSDTGHRKSIGVKATHERLQIYFGQGYGLTYYSELGKGTRVDILLPLSK